jgi:metal-dependent HD superfamily phosphatase/phosphodiesterase
VSEQPRTPVREAIAEARVTVPTRGNRKLERLLAAVNDDAGVKALWYASGVNATERLGMSDHSWVHIQIVVNIALRMARLLFRRGVVPNVVADHDFKERDAEVVIAAGALFHCVGMAVHRVDHEAFSLFLTADRLPRLLEDIYSEPKRTVIVAEALHAIRKSQSASRSSCPTRPGSSRSTSCWRPSCAAPGSRTTSRSSRASRPSTRSV